MRQLVSRKGMLLTLVIALAIPWNATAIHKLDQSSRLEAFIHGAPHGGIEGLLVRSLVEITQGKLDEALSDVDTVISRVPNFKLAYLVRGDLLQAKAHQISGFGIASNAPSEEIADFQQEAHARLERYIAHDARVPDDIWQLDSNQRYAIVVDTAKSRLYLYRNENGKPAYVADYYVTVGKNGTEKQQEGDKRTPLGVYFTGKQLDKEKLPDLYGSAAYPLSYPNEWDERQGKTGHGIWLHGSPSDTYSRPPRSSDGCVVLTNTDILSLSPVLQNGATPVVIARDGNGESNEAGSIPVEQREALLIELEEWRKHWQHQDTDRYLQYYSRDFFAQNMDIAKWSAEKRRIQQRKANVSITLSDMSIFRNPDPHRQMVVVNFNQDYRADSFSHKMRKRQYWELEDGHWKILYEGAA
jgi:murein L,D-transpeptidase YafK